LRAPKPFSANYGIHNITFFRQPELNFQVRVRGGRELGTVFGGKRTTMTLCHYSSEELDELQRLIDSIIAEAQQKSLNIPVEDIIERVFDLADRGERDPLKLREAGLANAA
jgi:hypothetical protein